jgi:hypothetical protein
MFKCDKRVANKVPESARQWHRKEKLTLSGNVSISLLDSDNWVFFKEDLGGMSYVKDMANGTKRSKFYFLFGSASDVSWLNSAILQNSANSAMQNLPSSSLSSFFVTDRWSYTTRCV